VSNIIKTNTTFGASVALESSWGCAFSLADPSNMDGSSLIRSLDPALSNKDIYELILIKRSELKKLSVEKTRKKNIGTQKIS
jgi:hypothetical protein